MAGADPGEEKGADVKVKIRSKGKTERGGYLMMPLRKNVPEGQEGWKLTRCQECGEECWDRPLPEGITEKMVDGRLCTICAIRKVLNT